MQIMVSIEVPDWAKSLLSAKDNTAAWAMVNEMVANATNPLAVFGLETKSSQRWAELTGVVVYDPDGWDRTNYQESWFNELITLDEFKRRVYMSTVLMSSLSMLDSL